MFNNIWKSDQESNIYYDQINIVSKFGTTTAEQKESIYRLKKLNKKQKNFLINQFFQEEEADKVNLNATNREMKDAFENAKKTQQSSKKPTQSILQTRRARKNF